MTFQQEAASWMFPTNLDVSPPPSIGSKAPASDKLDSVRNDGQTAVVTFLRHCGCPFAEKTFRKFREAAEKYPNVRFIAVSHSDKDSTDHWLDAVQGPGKVEMVVDPDRTLYAKWGLGSSSILHVLSPTSLWNLYKLGRDEGITNRPTESGTRWQTAGSYAVSKDGTVTWGGPSQSADEIPDFDEAARSTVKDGSGL